MSQRSARRSTENTPTPQEGVATLQRITTVIAAAGLVLAMLGGGFDLGIQAGQIRTNRTATDKNEKRITSEINRLEDHHREDMQELKQHIDKQFELLRTDIRSMNQRKGGQ